jgi:F-type H+-transporting ATPase subunit delta
VSELRLDAVTRRYTEALFELALRKDSLDAVQADVERIGRELSRASVGAFLFDTRVPIEERRAKLKPLLEQMHPLTANFVSLLFDKRREEVLRDLRTAFHQRRLVLDRAAEGIVESPAPLGVEDVERVADALSKKLGKSVRLQNRVTPDLIAGVRVTADNRMIDFSARGRLDRLRRSMLAAPLPSA